MKKAQALLYSDRNRQVCPLWTDQRFIFWNRKSRDLFCNTHGDTFFRAALLPQKSKEKARNNHLDTLLLVSYNRW